MTTPAQPPPGDPVAQTPTPETACEVPFLEQLRSIPKDGRCWYKHGECHHQNIPYGRYCHEAADRIATFERERDAARAELKVQEDVSAELTAQVNDAHAQLDAAKKEVERWQNSHLAAVHACEEERQQLTACQSALAEARKDGERLDWLEAQPQVVAGHTNPEWHLDHKDANGAWRCLNAPTLRQAIDAARAHGGKENGK